MLLSKKLKKKKKNGSIVKFSFSFLELWSLNKYCIFLQICAGLSKKSKSIKAIYLYPSERRHHALSENSMFYRGLNNISQDTEE